MNRFDFIVIGGGASGLAAAVSAKRNHPDYKIAIIEKLPRVGKKILATGNGRCNLSNLHACPADYYNGFFTAEAFKKYNSRSVISFFNSINLYTFADAEGRVYPRSNTAASVLDSLRYEIERLKIEVYNDIHISSVRKQGGLFIINNEFYAEKIVLSTGGKSGAVHGSDGSGYVLAESLGHEITRCYSSLAPLITRNDGFKSVKGIRSQNVCLKLEDHITNGEILFTDSGISGIAAMELSADADTMLSNGRKPYLYIDFLPDFSIGEIESIVENCITGKVYEEQILTGLVPKMLGMLIIKNTGKRIDDKTFSKSLAYSLKNYRIEITGTKGFENSQVTRGGVNVNQINSSTMESKICSGLYFSGEIVDVDGPCGGYNLQWAFSSGLLAGELK